MERKALRKLVITLTASVGGAIVAAQQPSAPAAKIRPDLIPREKATNPAPSGSAQLRTQKKSVGRGKLTVTTTEPVESWQEQVAAARGGMVTTDFLYDQNVGVVYGYREDDFKCANGQPGYGGILEALYSKGNQLKMPVGSGWYAVELNEKRCAAKESGIYGCKFDGNGNATKCGAATLNGRTGDIAIVAEQ